MKTVSSFAILILGLILGLVLFAYIFIQEHPSACTLEAKICPDGSAVGRNASRNCEFDPCPAEEGKTFCDHVAARGQFCAQIYQPVCGWFNEQIQCFRYPCANTYSNACEACKDEKVLYWTNGECPK